MYYVYIVTNWSHTVLYTGVTNNLERRLYEHANHCVPGYTSDYNAEKLVYFETTSSIKSAIAREKQLKGWRREKKIALINTLNPRWEDLSKTRRILYEP